MWKCCAMGRNTKCKSATTLSRVPNQRLNKCIDDAASKHLSYSLVTLSASKQGIFYAPMVFSSLHGAM